MKSDILDQDTLAELRMLQSPKRPTFLADVIKTFAANSSTLLKNLKTAVAAGNSEEIGSIAHSLKGSSRSVGAVRVTELATRLEELTDGAEIATVTQQLDTALIEAHQALDAVASA